MSQVAIITGASQGIGAGLVRAYRERNFSVVATSLSMGSSQDERVLAVAGDIRLRDTAVRVVAAAKERFGRIDSLVNNAGVFSSKPFVEYSEADFEQVMGVNVAGFFHVTQQAAVIMLEQRAGHIVNITAAIADQPRAAAPAVLTSLSKGGVAAATKALAIELAKHGIRVNAVAPGLVKTAMHPVLSDETAKYLPLGFMAEVRDVTDAVLFLESASSVTGETIHVDGGLHAGQP